MLPGKVQLLRRKQARQGLSVSRVQVREPRIMSGKLFRDPQRRPRLLETLQSQPQHPGGQDQARDQPPRVTGAGQVNSIT